MNLLLSDLANVIEALEDLKDLNQAQKSEQWQANNLIIDEIITFINEKITTIKNKQDMIK